MPLDDLTEEEAANQNADIKALVLRRGQLKGQLTRFSNYLENSVQFRISELKIRLQKIHELFNEFDIIQSRIEAIDISQIPEREYFEDQYYNLVSTASDIVSKQDVPSKTTNSFSQIPNNNITPIVNLQSISLPQFSGTYEGWVTFYEIFKSLVDDNRNLTKIQKFYYLQSCLKGEALNVLHSLEITENNYDLAISLLKERYENKRLLIHNHVKNIVESHCVQRESHQGLRKLIDNITQNYRALQTLQEPVEYWDTLLIFLVSNKLDANTRREWEVFNKSERPKYSEFLQFVKNKCQILETLDSKIIQEKSHKFDHKINKYVPSHSNPNFKKPSLTHVSTKHDSNNFNCNFCKQNSHPTYKCFKLLSFSCEDRLNELKKLNICINCLKKGHKLDDCTSKNCRICNKRHNSILHDYNNQNSPNNNIVNNKQKESVQSISNISVGKITDNSSEITSSQNNAQNESFSLNCTQSTRKVVCTAHENQNCQVLLATAIIHLFDINGKPVKCRALLDSASQSNFCTTELFKRLNLKSSQINMPVSGINQSACNISQRFQSRVESIDKSYKTTLEFLVIDQITSDLPQVSFDINCLKLSSNLKLADSNLNKSQKIDILLGTEIFFKLLNSERIHLGSDKPILQNTKLGWILAGPLHLNYSENQMQVKCFLSTNFINETVKKFWEIENVNNKSCKLTNEELDCEMHFRKNVAQDFTGRYIVKLPFKNNVDQLGESFYIAQKCLLSTENRLAKNSELRKYYNSFLDEYEKLGHMTLVDPNEDDPDKTYNYLPHHPVFKDSSTTSKVRIVFNASSKTTSGLSLNDVLKTGPKVQNDLFDIILRMRTYPVLIIADVEKMYRMVLIHESQRNYQRILWRDDPSKEISHYNLNTIVYGFSSSSFLATRVLNEIGQKCKQEYPHISEIIINDFYMDDLITGGNDVQSVMLLKNQITDILEKSGFHLRKWLSNDKRVLENDTLNEQQFHIKSDQETKTLGIVWDHYKDILSYTFEIKFNKVSITKRTILSGVAQLFDPLGLISPIIVKAKLILQEVWQNNLDWDDIVSRNISQNWLDFIETIKHINLIQIPRCVIQSKSTEIELHGFCDSSQLAFGAVIYICSSDNAGRIRSNIVCSKSRLAPLSSLSLPKLELSGALLLAQLMDRVKRSLRVKVSNITYWTDSTIVLAWLNAEPSKWKIFVSNRVAEIQRLSENYVWRHVDTHLNAADILSRGCDPITLQNESIWWHGPSFLTEEPYTWPTGPTVNITDIPEARKEKVILTYTNTRNVNDIFQRWSTYSKLVNITAYLLRFSKNCQTNVHSKRLSSSLSMKELDDAVLRLCSLTQKDVFAKEIELLGKNNLLKKNSRLFKLNPFVDSDGILRLGGRLKNANIDYNQKYPIILPDKHPWVKLIINYFHHKYLHAGPQFILSQIRTKFWPLNGRNQVRSVLKKCITCFRVKPLNSNQLMGSLPEPRVTPSRPFSSCGVDLAGPYLIKDGKTRNRSLIKVYITIFICFSTRAVHVELVSDLSSEAFLNAFKRFVSRRGLCEHIYSDNATNFVGSNNELLKLYQIVKNSVKQNFTSYFRENRINWHFIPPRSPHCGGLWESAVRSFKYHLKRIIGESRLDFESFYTILTQVEAILNSRPIIPLSDDPLDLQFLTPGHFLVGSHLLAVPQEDVTTIPTNRLKYFKQLQQIVQRFWKVWSKDYLHTLQQRKKWFLSNDNIQIGAAVIVKEDNEPPMHWILGRVVDVHPGTDNLVRVVSVRTKNGVFKRSITKLCPLPCNDI